MLYYHFPEERLDIDACPFFTVLCFGAITRGQKRSKNMNFLMHVVGEPLFQCVQGQIFVGIRGSNDCRVTFLEGAGKILCVRYRGLKKKSCA